MGHFSSAWILHLIVKAVIYSAVWRVIRTLPVGVDVAIVVVLVIVALSGGRRRRNYY